MQSRDYRELLKEIHGDSVDNWYLPEEEWGKESTMGGENILEFINHEVWKDTDTRQWRFKDKHFKREGQARKAARLYFRKKFS